MVKGIGRSMYRCRSDCSLDDLPSGRHDAAREVAAVDEQDALRFKRVTHRLDSGRQDRLTRFEAKDRAPTHRGGGREIALRPFERRAGHATLRRGHFVSIAAKDT